MKILKKNFGGYLSKKIWFPVCSFFLSHHVNVRTSKFWRKSKETKRNFFRKFTKGIYGFDLGKKKFKNISCLCTFKQRRLSASPFICSVNLPGCQVRSDAEPAQYRRASAAWRNSLCLKTRKPSPPCCVYQS